MNFLVIPFRKRSDPSSGFLVPPGHSPRPQLPARQGSSVALLLTILLMVWEASHAASWVEDFSTDPVGNGWLRWGEPSLFQWDASNAVLDVTWDSSHPNSYFYWPLGTVLTKQDDFQVRFEFVLDSIAIGVGEGKPYTFELAMGFIHFASATQTNFFRGSGMNATYGPRNLVELDYFPDSGFGATLAPTVVSTNNRIAFSDNHPLELVPGDRYEIVMTHLSSQQILRTQARRNGDAFGLPPNSTLADLDLNGFPDFRVDAVALCSYSDEHQSPPEFRGSLLARGAVDRIEATFPDPPLNGILAGFEDEHWKVEFEARGGWGYYLERSGAFREWVTVDHTTLGQDGPVVLVHTNAAVLSGGFYRVRAERP